MIIGLGGKAGSGKSTVAKILVDEFRFKEFAFADELKIYAQKYFGFTNEEIKTKPPHVRNIFQGLGSFVRYEVDEDFWIDKLDEKLVYEEGNIVISDVRYINEAEHVRGKGGILIRVESPSCMNFNHESETQLDGYYWDIVIKNDSTIHDLHYKVSDIIYGYIQKGELNVK